MNRRQFGLAMAGLPLGSSLLGQQDATFSTEVKVVNVLASVRTKKGELIRDLTKDDFSVLENGKPQAIRYFSQQTDLPLTIGLLVDTSMSQQRVLDQERSASFRFLDQVLRESKDQVFIMQFDMTAMVKQPLTSSHPKLEASLALVDTPSRSDLNMQTGGGTVLYDAVIQGSRDILMKQQGRKALILLTDGVDTGSQGTLQEAIDSATRADTLVYSILFSDETYYGGSGPVLGRGRFGMGIPLGGAEPDGRGVLVKLARETGGGFFEVSKKLSIEKIYGLIQDELRSQYNLGYVSDEPVRVSEFRKIRLTTEKKGLVIQARDKYWAKR